jgi:beta-lactamase regulating signal transducer with metallopeptidase domain
MMIGMLGDTYIDPSQPWLGTTTSTSSSTPWWQSVADVVSKVVGVAQKVAPTVTSISNQVNQLRASQATSYYPTYTPGTNSPVIPPRQQQNSNTGTILLIVGGLAIAAGITYVVVRSNRKKKDKKN